MYAVQSSPRRRPGPLPAQRLHARTGVAISPEDLLDSPHIFIGSIEGLTEKFLRLREELGISSVMLGEVDELTPIIG